MKRSQCVLVLDCSSAMTKKEKKDVLRKTYCKRTEIARTHTILGIYTSYILFHKKYDHWNISFWRVVHKTHTKMLLLYSYMGRKFSSIALRSVKELPKWFRTIYNYKLMPISFLFHRRNVSFHVTTWYWGNHNTYADLSGVQERTEYEKLGISQHTNLIFFYIVVSY